MRTAMAAALAAAVITGSACAQLQKRDETADVERPREEGLDDLRGENAALKRRVQLLEDRLANLEAQGLGSGDAQRVKDRAGDLPIERLRPVPTAKREGSSAAPSHRSERVAKRAGAKARSLAQVPHSAPQFDELGGEDEGWPSDEAVASTAMQPVAEQALDTAARSYRLVGSELVQHTKTHGPIRPDRPDRRGKGRAIVGEYDQAMAVYKSGRLADAERAFAAFAERYPQHDYADNAIYWKGEAAYDQGRYSDALAAFTDVIERYGGGNKAPDALLKIGLCYERLGDAANARDVLAELIAAYPRARASDVARVRLAEIGT